MASGKSSSKDSLPNAKDSASNCLISIVVMILVFMLPLAVWMLAELAVVIAAVARDFLTDEMGLGE